MASERLNAGQRIALELLWCGAWLFAILPRWVKYHVVQNLLFVILAYAVRYRRRVVVENLANSFPEKTPKELRAIRRRFYLTLAEIFVDTLDLAHMPPRKALRRLEVEDAGAHHTRTAGRDWIALTAHLGCWEYCSFWGFHDSTQRIVAVYHPLRSAVVDALYRRLRLSEAAQPVPMKEAMRFFLRHTGRGLDGRNLVLGLIADQSPPRRADSHWLTFLNQETSFFDGGEKLALRCHLPVYFVRMKRLARGRYRMSFEQLYDGEEAVAPNEITERYVRCLEAEIRACPELWMWSHRRWKRKRRK